MFFGSTGDILLARGMKDLGPVHLNHPLSLIAALANPWVFAGILCLIGFFGSYMTALSWADLTYVLPATAFSYVLLALLSKYFLHENISAFRWAGILLISCVVCSACVRGRRCCGARLGLAHSRAHRGAGQILSSRSGGPSPVGLSPAGGGGRGAGGKVAIKDKTFAPRRH